MENFIDIKEGLNPLKWFIIGIFCYLLYLIVIFAFILPYRDVYSILYASHYIIHPTFIIYIPLNIFIFIILFHFLQISFKDLNSNIFTKKGYIILIITIWIIAEILKFLFMIIFNINPILNPAFQGGDESRYYLGVFISQYFLSFFEELFFRVLGIIAVEYYLSNSKKKKDAMNKHKWIPLLIPQVLFSLLHIPTLIYNGYTPFGMIFFLLSYLVIGICLAVIYLKSHNLILIIFLHASLTTGLIVINANSEILNTLSLLPVSLLVIYFISRKKQFVK